MSWILLAPKASYICDNAHTANSTLSVINVSYVAYRQLCVSSVGLRVRRVNADPGNDMRSGVSEEPGIAV